MNTEKTGEFIAELRKEKQLTQSQLATAIHVSDKAISRWETGRGLPDIDNLEALSDYLDVFHLCPLLCSYLLSRELNFYTRYENSLRD